MFQDGISVSSILWVELQLEKLIGKGILGEVYKGKWKNQDVAIKVLHNKVLPISLKNNFIYEATAMFMCQHPNIISLHGICTEPDHYAIIMEYCDNKSLYEFLQDFTGNKIAYEALSWQIAIDVAKGLDYLHKKGIIHKDLKSRNILLDSHHRAKIADFEFTRIKQENLLNNCLTGTVRWRDPKLFKRGVKATTATDLYSYGMILWELITKQLPFKEAIDELTVATWLKDGEREIIPDNCHPTWQQIIQSCWSTEIEIHHTAEVIANNLIAARQQMELKPLGQESFQPQPSLQIIVDKDQCFHCDHGNLKKSLELTTFLQHICHGRQDEAEKMLHINPTINLVSGDVVDYANRKFINITGLQYSLWSLDWHMWKMLIKYITIKDLQEQVKKLEKGTWVEEHGVHVSWQKLIDHFTVYILNYINWTNQQRKTHWSQEIGNAQLSLPAHVIQEYCREDRSFHPIPAFTETNFPRKNILELIKNNKIIGVNCGLVRGARVKKEGYMERPDPINGVGHPKRDRAALIKLFNVRLKQCNDFIQEIIDGRLFLPYQFNSIKIENYIGEHSDMDPKETTNVLIEEQVVVKFVAKQDDETAIVPQINILLEHIAFGRQDEAQIMIEKNATLLLEAGEVSDCGNRRFIKIMPLQYAMWALDWHMCNMLKKYLSMQDVKQQIENIQHGSWVKEHGVNISWQKLIEALQVYIENYHSWTNPECNLHWIQKVGMEQRVLPAHVIQEYCREDQQFGKFPTADLKLPRVNINGSNIWFENCKGELLGDNFARVRGYLKKSGRGRSIPIKDINNPKLPDSHLHWINSIKYDQKALSTLLGLRLNQCTGSALINSYTLKTRIDSLAGQSTDVDESYSPEKTSQLFFSNQNYLQTESFNPITNNQAASESSTTKKSLKSGLDMYLARTTFKKSWQLKSGAT